MCKLGTTLSQELILNRQDVIDKTVQNWNRMQNAAECVWGGGGYFINVKNTLAGYINLTMCVLFTKCEILV